MRKYVSGVTLLELLIVITIVGLLAMIAYPNYRDYAARAKRSEAKAALLQIASNEERFYLQNNTYTADMTKLGFSADSNVTSDTGSYVINVTAANASNFTASAVYQHDDNEAGKCKTYGIDGTGAKTSSPQSDCWTRTR